MVQALTGKVDDMGTMEQDFRAILALMELSLLESEKTGLDPTEVKVAVDEIEDKVHNDVNLTIEELALRIEQVKRRIAKKKG